MTHQGPNRPATVGVVIASVGRRQGLRAVLDAIDRQEFAERATIAVVDDGYRPRLMADEVRMSRHDVLLLQGPASGPSAARNSGVAALDTEVVFFTDDDTIPAPTWFAAGLSAFDESGVVGVEGPVMTPPYDPLYEYSISASGGGHFWTCNVAYRRSAFLAVGGFDEVTFPRYREDRDLAYRVAALGVMRYASEMRISHTPRRVGLKDRHRLVLAARADIELERRHPQAFAFHSRVPRPLRPVTLVTRHLRELAAHDPRSLRSPRRLARFVAIGAVEIAAALRVVMSIVRVELSQSDSVTASRHRRVASRRNGHQGPRRRRH